MALVIKKRRKELYEVIDGLLTSTSFGAYHTYGTAYIYKRIWPFFWWTIGRANNDNTVTVYNGSVEDAQQLSVLLTDYKVTIVVD